MFPTFLILWILASSSQTSRTTSMAQQMASCPPKICGNLTISDPFWLVQDQGMERPCGLIDYQVYCYKNSPFLRSTIHDGFGIRDIIYQNNTFLAADINKMEDFNRCQVPITNTSFKIGFLPFTISPANRYVLFFYDCTEQAAAPKLKHDLVRMSCGNKAFVRLGRGPYIASHDYAEYFIEGCKTTLVPVLGDSAKTQNASDYKQLIMDGFLLTWPMTNGQFSREGKKRTDRKIILIVSTSAAASFLFPCIYMLIWHRKGQKLCCFLFKKISSNTDRNIEAAVVSYGSLAPKRYKYSEVTKITSYLGNKLGEGGYGVVFKGRLHDGRLVAVKFLHDSKGKGEEFVNEVMSIGRTSHVNIVSLFGFCLEGSKRALIYEYMPGSLDKYIYSESPKEILGWDRLCTIAIGIARGLEYLHHSCNTRIVHFDIKPQNMLLDHDFCPKVADFGLAKLCRTKESKLSMTGARGTIGFIAPEVIYRTFGVVSTKSDVYSYGMMLLEMVGGRRNVKSIAEKSSEKYFPDWIYDHFAQDGGLQACEVTSEIEEIAKKMVLIGLWCIQVLPMQRPTMTKVLEMFDRSLDQLDMPPKQNFCELMGDSADKISTVESASSSSLGKALQTRSEMLQVEEMSLVSSKILKRLRTL